MVPLKLLIFGLIPCYKSYMVAFGAFNAIGAFGDNMGRWQD